MYRAGISCYSATFAQVWEQQTSGVSCPESEVAYILTSPAHPISHTSFLFIPPRLARRAVFRAPDIEMEPPTYIE